MNKNEIKAKLELQLILINTISDQRQLIIDYFKQEFEAIAQAGIQNNKPPDLLEKQLIENVEKLTELLNKFDARYSEYKNTLELRQMSKEEVVIFDEK